MIKKPHEDEKKAKEAAELRGEAKAYGVVGAMGAAGWAAMEFLSSPLLIDAVEVATDKAAKTKHKLAFAVGVVAMGAAIIALAKHSHASKIEEERKNQNVPQLSI